MASCLTPLNGGSSSTSSRSKAATRSKHNRVTQAGRATITPRLDAPCHINGRTTYRESGSRDGFSGEELQKHIESVKHHSATKGKKEEEAIKDNIIYEKHFSEGFDKKLKKGLISEIKGSEIVSTFRRFIHEEETVVLFKLNQKDISIAPHKSGLNESIRSHKIMMKILRAIDPELSIKQAKEQAQLLKEPSLRRAVYTKGKLAKVEVCKQLKTALCEHIKEGKENKKRKVEKCIHDDESFSLGFKLWCQERLSTLIKKNKNLSPEELAALIVQAYSKEDDFSIWGKHIPTLKILQSFCLLPILIIKDDLQNHALRAFDFEESPISVHLSATPVQFHLNIKNERFDTTQIRSIGFYRKDDKRVKEEKKYLGYMNAKYILHGQLTKDKFSCDLALANLTFTEHATKEERELIEQKLRDGSLKV